MENTPVEIASLIYLYIREELSDEQHLLLTKWLEESQHHKAIFDKLTNEQRIKEGVSKLYAIKNAAPVVLSDIKTKIHQEVEAEKSPSTIHRVHSLTNSLLKYAAVLLVIIGTVTLYLISKSKGNKNNNQQSVANINPGTNRATLILSDGKQIIINDSSDNSITDGSVSINRDKDILTYNNVLTSEDIEIGNNTMITPRGGQYKIILPDGSKVWLNSASSLKYPVAFNGRIREVELQGEAYFEIKSIKMQPFYVKTQKVTINVIGTSFNLNAYPDESEVSTTLIEGAVKVMSMKDAVVLKPGEQANISSNKENFTKTKPNLDEVLAWKNGKYKFDGASLQRIMRQISRWYDVDIKYQGAPPQFEFSGSFSRSAGPYGLLNALELTGDVHFEINKKSIIVVPGSRKKN